MKKNYFFVFALSLAVVFTGCQDSEQATSQDVSSIILSSSELSSSEPSSLELSSEEPSSTTSSETPASKQVSSKQAAPPVSSNPQPSPSKPTSSNQAPSSSQSDPSVPTNDAVDGEYSPSGYASVENEILRLMNDLRASLGAAPLQKSKLLCDTAYIRSKEMFETDYFEHTRPDGSSYTTAFDAAGYQWSSVGENIGYCDGYSANQLAEALFESWKNSPGHYENMVKTKFKQVGISIYFDGTTCYATQSFGTPKQ